MKKFLSFILITIMCVLPLSACSTDFSGQIKGAMDDLYNSIKEIAEPFLKQDDKYSSDTNTGSSTESDTGKDELTVPTGTNVGERLPSFELQAFDETGLLNEYVDPTKTGKVTVINFWGIWCPYCIQEMPAFDEVASEYSDEIQIVAIHSTYRFSNGAVDYVNANFKDSRIIFAKDEISDGGDLDNCYEAFGGNGNYPYTIIIDENGVITYKVMGAINKSTLTNEIEKALGN